MIRVGDVIIQQGRLWVCNRWSESAARIKPLEPPKNAFTPRFIKGEANEGGQMVAIEKKECWARISANYEGEIYARLGAGWAGRKEDVAGLLARHRTETGTAETTNNETKGEDGMATKTKKTARGGLAAVNAEMKKASRKARTPKSPKAETNGEPKLKGGKRIRPFGFSACEIINGAAKAGATKEQVIAFLAKNGIALSNATISQNMSGKHKAADLTAAQITEIKG